MGSGVDEKKVGFLKRGRKRCRDRRGGSGTWRGWGLPYAVLWQALPLVGKVTDTQLQATCLKGRKKYFFYYNYNNK